MWKKLIICLTLTALVCADDDDVGMTCDEILDTLEGFTENCDPKPDREHMKQMLQNDENPHNNAKCFRHCLLQQIDVIKDGETAMVEEEAVRMLGMMYDEASPEDLSAMVQTCNENNKGYTEKCENAHQHGMCIVQELKKREMKVPKICS